MSWAWIKKNVPKIAKVAAIGTALYNAQKVTSHLRPALNAARGGRRVKRKRKTKIVKKQRRK